MNEYDLSTESDADDFAAYEWWLAGQPHAMSKQMRPAHIGRPVITQPDITIAQPSVEIQQAKYYAHTDTHSTTVLLGEKALADTQRATEEGAGGLVAWMFSHH